VIRQSFGSHPEGQRPLNAAVRQIRKGIGALLKGQYGRSCAETVRGQKCLADRQDSVAWVVALSVDEPEVPESQTIQSTQEQNDGPGDCHLQGAQRSKQFRLDLGARLFVAQGDRGVDLGSAAGGNVAGGECDQRKQDSDTREG
jgi:hypothetical protein